MKGISVINGDLYINDSLIATGNDKGLGIHIKPPRDLYYDDTFLVRGDENISTGIEYKEDAVVFDNTSLANDVPINPDEFSPEGYWIGPVQPKATEERLWNYQDYISRYDRFTEIDSKFTKHTYKDPDGVPYVAPFTEHNYHHYKFEPENYTKTILIQAAIHGTERDCRVSCFRMIEALIIKRKQYGYTAWQELYNNCRLIIIPVASPYGVDYATSNIKYSNAEAPEKTTINPNRNYDFRHQGSNEVGFGGLYPFEIYDTRHAKHIIDSYGVTNIDCVLDMHDGFATHQHYGVTFSVDHDSSRIAIRNLVDYMVERHVPDGDVPDIGGSRDGPTPGGFQQWAAKTMGLAATNCEWFGGIFPYDFSSEQMTHSFELRSNVLFELYKADTESWVIREPVDANYFHFDYPKSFTRFTMQPDIPTYQGVNTTHKRTLSRWDALLAANPEYITKSASLGLNTEGDTVHSYTVGSGAKKVMFIGGVMRRDADNRINEYATYLLVEYLCDPYIVNQSKFLRDLKDNYAIVILPCIDVYARKLYEPDNAINLSGKWEVVDGKAQVVGVNHDTQIVKNLIDANTDAKCIVTGGEIDAQYPSEYQTQFVIPLNQSNNLTAYSSHLTANRSEIVTVERTQGMTFMDYAYDNHSIPCYAMQLHVSDRHSELQIYHVMTEEDYLHSNYEAGRRMANVANLFLE